MSNSRKLQNRHLQSRETGFTLVELAIALVVIGLLIGGILVGRDLIKSAEIHATTAMLERYNAAAGIFHNKYGGHPGDLLASRANKFGFTTRSGTAAHGDNNGIIEGCSLNSVYLGCETGLFWTDLTEDLLIEGSFPIATDALLNAATSTDIRTYLPVTPLRETSFISVYTEGGRNYFLLATFSGIVNGVQTFSAAGGQAVSALEASMIDEKVDDGAPITGLVRVVSGWNAGGSSGADVEEGAAPGTGVCVDQGANPAVEGDERYNLNGSDIADELNCALSIRASF